MKFQTKGKFVFFATHNLNKFQEVRWILRKNKIAIGMLKVKTPEIQSDNLKEIAETCAVDIYEKCSLPLMVEDAGLFIEALKGFPGSYSAYVYQTIGNKGLLRIMEQEKNRNATFKSVVAFYSSQEKKPVCFTGEVVGDIEKFSRRSKQKIFGFDPIFKPKNSNKTFAEMTILEKNRCSHRAKAFKKFAEWYTSST